MWPGVSQRRSRIELANCVEKGISYPFTKAMIPLGGLIDVLSVCGKKEVALNKKLSCG
jgi:hypothetical protein